MEQLKNSKALKSRVRSREQVWGAWTQTAHESVAQIYGRLEYDFLVIDAEHAAISESEIARVCHTLRGTRTVPLVRVREKTLSQIRIALDLGAGGIIAPMTESRHEAEEFIKYAKYPPTGVRGVGYGPCNNLGIDLKDYVRDANESILCIAQIETRAGIENLESILAVSEIDGAFIGPYDLSCSYGVTGELDHSQVQGALMRFTEVCSKSNKGAGLHIVQPDVERLQKSIRDGFTWGALGIDVTAIESVARTMRSFVVGRQF